MKTVIGLVLTIGLFGCATQAKKKSDQESSSAVPRLKRPEVRRIWVPDQIVGDEYVTGHWKYLIERNAVWTKEN